MNRKVLIVDDSALMRKFHKNLLEQAGFITAQACNGKECLSVLPDFSPDVIVLDINMPVMDGLSCLKEIMLECPTPVVMVSSLTLEGAQSSLDAIALGAVDYIQKPNGQFTYNMGELSTLMVEKIIAAANIKPEILSRNIAIQREQRRKADPTVQPNGMYQYRQSAYELIVIGVSTGGPNCLQTILPSLDSSFSTPIVIAQHMPGRFTKVFAQRLDAVCNLKVVEVTQKLALEKGHIYIAQGDSDITIVKEGNKLFTEPTRVDPNYLWHPSVSKLVSSALNCIVAKKLCCVQLTGMGNDGADEMYEAYKKGATTIAESEETAVVFGMPSQLIKKNGATHVAPNHLIASLLI